MNIFDIMDENNKEFFKYLDSQKEVFESFSDVLGEESERERRQEIRRETEIDPETGKLTREHNESCSGCSLCEI